MATAVDWETRKARVKNQVETELPALITNFELKTRSLNDLTQQVRKLEDEKGRLQHEIDKAEQEASTADREFIERKETFPDPFKPSKIYTVQDFTFFLFFISYVLFLTAVSLVVQEKIKVFIGGILLLFFIVILFYRYI